MTIHGRTDTQELIRLPDGWDETYARKTFGFDEGPLPLVPFVDTEQPAPVEGKEWVAGVVWSVQAVTRTWTQQTAPPPPVPATITPRQMRLWLNSKSNAQGNFFTQATAAINAAGPDQRANQIQWDYATVIERTHPLVYYIATTILGLTEAQTDEAFREASQIP